MFRKVQALLQREKKRNFHSIIMFLPVQYRHFFNFFKTKIKFTILHTKS